ncbi:thioredoxin family protein [Pedobacter chinensis]|uniref:Thioredoxin family protein n=1 Tax=Pedobacter chinensis TaxID=2282421 RepID=A0A369PVN6_9SPHI|nr:thioredoxin family protein [Pedobacter chinensis]RDC56653.1 thioredoxin family protein [Pedobacter chinensis]
MKKIKLVLVLCGLVVACFAQEKKGINFRSFDNWRGVLDASTKENKPIFVDFYTTWCGPCKKMEQVVYTDSAVGFYFNKHFISVKIQMDKTSKDSEQVQKWYNEIAMLEKKYEITGYPALLFISSKGNVLNRYDGYQKPKALIETASLALKPEQKYVRPGGKYYDLINNYHQGRTDGIELIRSLYEFQKNDKNSVNYKTIYFTGIERLKDTLTLTTLSYLRKRPFSSLFQKEILEIVGTVGVSSKDPLFQLFYPDTDKVDKIVGKNGFARLVVDRVIRNEHFKKIVNAHFASYKSGFNWDSLYNVVKSHYNEDYAIRAIKAAKTMVAYQTHDMRGNPYNPLYINGIINMVKTYGPNVVLIYEPVVKFGSMEPFKGGNLDKLQNILIEAFCNEDLLRNSFDQTQLHAGLKMMDDIMNWARENKSEWLVDWSNTYGCLLYKTGQKEKAISIIQEGLNFAKQHKESGLDVFTEKSMQSLAKIKDGKILWSEKWKN